MSSDTAGWRSKKSYDYIDRLTAPDIGWEWLRRNEDYRRDYTAITKPSAAANPAASHHITSQWGLRFPRIAFS